ncbi:unnamed protein product, partial [Prunus brigantina]
MNGSCLQSITTPKKACKNIEIGALGRRSRFDRTCMVESNRGKHGRVRSAFGIVKHGGVTPMNLGKSRP